MHCIHRFSCHYWENSFVSRYRFLRHPLLWHPATPFDLIKCHANLFYIKLNDKEWNCILLLLSSVQQHFQSKVWIYEQEEEVEKSNTLDKIESFLIKEILGWFIISPLQMKKNSDIFFPFRFLSGDSFSFFFVPGKDFWKHFHIKSKEVSIVYLSNEKFFNNSAKPHRNFSFECLEIISNWASLFLWWFSVRIYLRRDF